MAKYYVNTNAQENGDHEVHKEDCYWLPAPGNREFLGDFPSCHGAVAAAKLKYPKADGCAHCCPARHTR